MQGTVEGQYPDDRLKEVAKNRGDDWGLRDLFAEEGRYHRDCCINFLREVKLCPTAEKCNPFNALVCDHLDESEERQYTFSELEKLFARFSDGDTVYTRKHLLLKLSARYGSDLVINAKKGPCSDSTACFRDKAAHTLQENWTQRGLNHSDEDIIDMAAMLVRNAIRLMPYCQ